MKSPFRALLWEQSRVAGILSLWIIGLGFLLMLGLFVQNDLSPYDVKVFNIFFVFVLLLVYTPCLIYRRDANGHLTGGFEKRLTRLPLRTPLLALTILYIRLFFFCITAGTLFLSNKVLFEGDVPGACWIGLLEIYLVLQMVDWSRKTLHGLSWVPLLFFVVVALAVAMGEIPKDRDVLIGELVFQMVSLRVGLLLLTACTLMSWLSVHALRHDTCYGVPGPLALMQQLREMGKERTQAFSSPANALLWYEWKRHGWKLPVRMLFVCIFLYLRYFAFRDPSEEVPDFLPLSFSVYTIPLIALLLVTPFTGWLTTGFRFILRRPQSQFPAIRPVTPNDHAWAKWLMLLKSLLLATGIAGCLSLIGTIAFSSFNTRLIWNIFQEGEINAFEIIMLYTAPLLGTLVLAWLLYFKETAAILLVCVLSTSFYLRLPLGDDSDFAAYYALVFHTCLAFFLLSGILSYAVLARYRRQVSWRWIISSFFLWALLSQQVLSVNTDLQFSNRFSLMVVGYIGLIFIPFFSPFLHSPKTVQPQDRKKMWRREFRRPGFLLPITMLLLCLGLSFFVLSHPSTAHKKLKEEGCPLNFEELEAFYEAVPEEENAAPYYLAAHEKLKMLDWELRDKLHILDYTEAFELSESIFSEEMRTAIQQNLEENQQTLALLREASTYPKARYPSNYVKYWHGGTPAIVSGGQLSDLLLLEALWWALNDQPVKVLDSLQNMHHLAQSFKPQPVPYAQGTRIGSQRKINRTIQYLLTCKRLSDDTLSALQQIVGTPENPPKSFIRALKGEVALCTQRYARKFDRPYSPMSKSEFLFTRFSGTERIFQTLATHHTRKILQSYQESMKAARAFDRSVLYQKYLNYINIPCIDTGFYIIGNFMTEQNLVQTALAIERFERAKGRLPEQLTELVPKYLDSIPWDYYGDAPVRYRQTEKGYVVYGTGRDGEDHGGLPCKKKGPCDQLFRVERVGDKENHTTVDAEEEKQWTQTESRACSKEAAV